MKQLTFFLLFTFSISIIWGQDIPITKDNIGLEKKKTYSPYADRNFPTRVFWGDSHLHTSLSLDARAAGVILDPNDALRFARGEEVTASQGMRVKLSRPLDWLVVTDHSDAMGAMNKIVDGDPMLMADPQLKDWHTRLKKDQGYEENKNMFLNEGFINIVFFIPILEEIIFRSGIQNFNNFTILNCI